MSEATATGGRSPLARFAERLTAPRVVRGAEIVARAVFWTIALGLAAVVACMVGPVWLIVIIPSGVVAIVVAWATATGIALGGLFGRAVLARATWASVGGLLAAVGASTALAALAGAEPWTLGRRLLDELSSRAIWVLPGAVVAVAAALVPRRGSRSPRSIAGAALCATALAAAALLVIAAVLAMQAGPRLDPDDLCDAGSYTSGEFPVRVQCTIRGLATVFTASPLVVVQLGALIVAGAAGTAALSVALARDGAAARVGAAWLAVLLAVGIGTTGVALAVSSDGVADAARRFGDDRAAPVPESTPLAPPTPATNADGLTAMPLDDARAQFALLAAAAVEAAGDDAVWRSDPPFAVVEEACEGGVRLRLDGEFARGVITDTSSDEADREVIARNVEAADRIAAAWRAAGLGPVERLHDEPQLGGGALGSVEAARVSFDFGVAQPRVTGRCIAAG